MFCYVPGCPNGRTSGKKCKTMVQIFFSAPEDETLFKKWQDAVPKSDHVFSRDDKLCEFHFKKSEVILFIETKLPDGNVRRLPASEPKLKSGTIPSIFPDVESTNVIMDIEGLENQTSYSYVESENGKAVKRKYNELEETGKPPQKSERPRGRPRKFKIDASGKPSTPSTTEKLKKMARVEPMVKKAATSGNSESKSAPQSVKQNLYPEIEENSDLSPSMQPVVPCTIRLVPLESLLENKSPSKSTAVPTLDKHKKRICPQINENKEEVSVKKSKTNVKKVVAESPYHQPYSMGVTSTGRRVKKRVLDISDDPLSKELKMLMKGSEKRRKTAVRKDLDEICTELEKIVNEINEGDQEYDNEDEDLGKSSNSTNNIDDDIIEHVTIKSEPVDEIDQKESLVELCAVLEGTSTETDSSERVTPNKKHDLPKPLETKRQSPGVKTAWPKNLESIPEDILKLRDALTSDDEDESHKAANQVDELEPNLMKENSQAEKSVDELESNLMKEDNQAVKPVDESESNLMKEDNQAVKPVDELESNLMKEDNQAVKPVDELESNLMKEDNQAVKPVDELESNLMKEDNQAVKPVDELESNLMKEDNRSVKQVNGSESNLIKEDNQAVKQVDELELNLMAIENHGDLAVSKEKTLDEKVNEENKSVPKENENDRKSIDVSPTPNAENHEDGKKAGGEEPSNTELGEKEGADVSLPSDSLEKIESEKEVNDETPSATTECTNSEKEMNDEKSATLEKHVNDKVHTVEGTSASESKSNETELVQSKDKELNDSTSKDTCEETKKICDPNDENEDGEQGNDLEGNEVSQKDGANGAAPRDPESNEDAESVVISGDETSSDAEEKDKESSFADEPPRIVEVISLSDTFQTETSKKNKEISKIIELDDLNDENNPHARDEEGRKSPDSTEFSPLKSTSEAATYDISSDSEADPTWEPDAEAAQVSDDADTDPEVLHDDNTEKKQNADSAVAEVPSKKQDSLKSKTKKEEALTSNSLKTGSSPMKQPVNLLNKETIQQILKQIKLPLTEPVTLKIGPLVKNADGELVLDEKAITSPGTPRKILPRGGLPQPSAPPKKDSVNTKHTSRNSRHIDKSNEGVAALRMFSGLGKIKKSFDFSTFLSDAEDEVQFKKFCYLIKECLRVVRDSKNAKTNIGKLSIKISHKSALNSVPEVKITETPISQNIRPTINENTDEAEVLECMTVDSSIEDHFGNKHSNEKETV